MALIWPGFILNSIPIRPQDLIEANNFLQRPQFLKEAHCSCQPLIALKVRDLWDPQPPGIIVIEGEARAQEANFPPVHFPFVDAKEVAFQLVVLILALAGGACICLPPDVSGADKRCDASRVVRFAVALKTGT